MRLMDMAEVRRAHRGYWFDRSAMRFFRSRVSEGAYVSEDGARAFFVSSERGEYGPRLYSVRVCDLATGDVDTVDGFQSYASRSGAHAAAVRLASGDDA